MYNINMLLQDLLQPFTYFVVSHSVM